MNNDTDRHYLVFLERRMTSAVVKTTQRVFFSSRVHLSRATLPLVIFLRPAA